jgi:hypothetical protein
MSAKDFVYRNPLRRSFEGKTYLNLSQQIRKMDVTKLPSLNEIQIGLSRSRQEF